MNKTFQQLRTQWPWRPIRNCPGRFVIHWPEQAVPLEVLLDQSCSPQKFLSPEAKDPVWVVAFEGGGLISYQQPDGRMIHTLNTLEGFSRKIQQLGITLPTTCIPSPQEPRD